MGIERGLFNRTELLVGNTVMDRIGNARVVIFGVGGVGSWCAESLIRSGIRHLTIVDSDRVCVTNINRQLMATTKTVGQVKVDVLKARLMEINPKAEITALQQIYEADTAASFQLDSYDYIVDAIDSLENKADLIRRATRTNAVFISSMGAALKLDPLKIQVAEFWKVKGCPLAAALRRKMKKGEKPAKKFKCVFSEELLENKGSNSSCGTEKCLCPKTNNGPGDPDLVNHEWCSLKARINGTMAHTTAIFGFTLAGLIMQDLYGKEN
ncbi:tRNA threonylcarbamoyladenosine dehydratase [Massilibacteroides sp.]|uniref:tRNA threonylcarbamoyladenosine dehydratase n=1 Tax=Massilibacteroides sp. TaxID=2034766 RepID=UPI00263A278B|nr:tRNA threonylcarbamoyladenosine dehydratase [Massilibacteroides sp.]MDD4514016.1 tRNA threonylcarbamoyladenosine dehydratase [Massilibacteroides sp.]